MDIQQLKNFLTVAQELNFTRAAEKIAIVQPALSRQIQLLEEEMGILLFERTNRKVKLTPAGEVLQKDISRILDDLRQRIDYAKLIQSGEVGEIRIGHSSTAMNTIIPDLMVKIEAVFPKIKIQLIEDTNKKQFEMLLSRELDIGFCPNIVMHHAFEQVPIYDEPFVLILPNNHPISNQNFVSLHQFQDEHFIIPPLQEGMGYVEILHQMCRRYGFLPKTIHESANSSSVLRLVEAGVGITIEPRSTLNGFNLNLKSIELNTEPERAQMVMLYLKERVEELAPFIDIMGK